MGFSRQEYWSGFSCPPPGDLPNPGIKPRSLAWQVVSLPSETPGKPIFKFAGILDYLLSCLNVFVCFQVTVYLKLSFKKKNLFFSWWKLLYNSVLVSAVQQHESVTCWCFLDPTRSCKLKYSYNYIMTATWLTVTKTHHCIIRILILEVKMYKRYVLEKIW